MTSTLKTLVPTSAHDETARRIHADTAVALSMVYPSLTYHADGMIDARIFFAARPEDAPWQQASTDLLRAGGVRLLVLSNGVNEPEHFPGDAGAEFMRRVLKALQDEIDRDARYFVIHTASDLNRLDRRSLIGILLHMTGVSPLNGSTAALREFFNLGVRAIHPFLNDAKAGGFAGGSKDDGLTPWGLELVGEIQRLNMVLDLTHANDRTFDQVMAQARGPVIDSHTNCRALCEHERNRTDDQLRAIAATGGVVGVHFGSLFIDAQPNPHRQKLLVEMRQRMAVMLRDSANAYEYLSKRYDPWAWSQSLGGAVDDGHPIPHAPLSRLADHIDHLAQTIGIDHIGIGTDYSLGNICSGVQTAADLPNLTALLLARGWTEPDLRKFLGGNFARVFRQVLPSS